MLNKISPLWFVIAGLMAFRLISLSMYPLLDSTEARYGEIARLMIETNNWITPQFDYNIPFWGKPPLHTWITALSGKLFGISEFSLRLPHLITGMISLFFMAIFANRLKLSVATVLVVLTSTAGFFIASGMIMTDSLLLLSMIMAMTGFFIALRQGSRLFAYIGFVGIGIGLLAKGPLILILIGLAIFPWLVVNYGLFNGIKVLRQQIPLFTGLVIISVIALPWYIAAERATPGFLNYFLVGEHFLRFVQSGWTGDLYGTAHSRPRGIIWAYWLAVAFPWSFYFGALMLSNNHRNKLFTKQPSSEHEGLTSYLVFWLISPMLLFTLSGNILPIYVLPGLPALAILVARVQNKVNFSFIATSLLTPLLFVVVLAFVLPDLAANKSDKQLLANIDQRFPVYYLAKRTFSGRFYMQGKTKTIGSLDELNSMTKPFYLVLRNNVTSMLNDKHHCDVMTNNKKRSLLLCQY